MGFQRNNGVYGSYIFEHSVESAGHSVCQGTHVSLSGQELGGTAKWSKVCFVFLYAHDEYDFICLRFTESAFMNGNNVFVLRSQCISKRFLVFERMNIHSASCERGLLGQSR